MMPPEEEEEESEEDDEAEAPEEEDVSEEADESEEEQEEEADESEEEQEEEAEEEPTESEEPEERGEASGETSVLHLNLDGLYLDLLGLEVNLEEVTLDINALEGEGNLVGNLLSAVSGLLDSPDLLGGLLGDGDGEGGLLPSLPSLNPKERAQALASWIAERLRGMVGQAIAALPLEELLSQFFEALIDSVLEGDGGEEEAAA